MRFLIRTLVILTVIGIIGYFAGGYLITKVSRTYVAKLQPKLESKGLKFQTLSYKDVTLNSFKGVKVNEVESAFLVEREVYGISALNASFKAKNVELTLASVKDRTFKLAIHDFSLNVEPDDANGRHILGQLKHGNFSSELPISLESPESSVKAIIEQVANLLEFNKAAFITLSGRAVLNIDDKEINLGIHTLTKGDSAYLEISTEDVLVAASEFDIELTQQEAEVIANHPGKIPAMIKITRAANQKSRAYGSAYRNFPEDAFRHVYWSYHLTRQLGPDLAKQITDAHETAPGNTPQERSMDYHNNEVGRDLANTNLSENQIRALVLESNNVVRQPGQATD